MKIKERKGEHLKICEKDEVEYDEGPGFDCVEFVHNSLPEIDYSEVKLETEFCGKKIFPLMITAVTGGFEGAGKLNSDLAEAAEKYRFAFGLGSERPLLEGGSAESYKVRKAAPSIPVIGNIGGSQLKKFGAEKVSGLVSKVEADGFAVHLNPLQEMVQPEGDREFRGILSEIGKLCDVLDVPVIVKETGAGINRSAAEKLKAAGVKMIDVAGAGGTSWSKVEYGRGGKPPGFEEWGIPTAVSVLTCKWVMPVIASGGVRSGIDAAKAVVLGAEFAGAARPFLIAHNEKRLDEMCSEWVEQMKISALLTGSRNMRELGKAPVVITGWLSEWVE